MTPADAIAVLERRAADAAYVGRTDSELEKVIRALVGNAGGFAELSDLRDAVRAELIAAGWRYDWEGNGSFLPDDEIVPALREALAQRAEAMEIAGRIAAAVERAEMPIETDHTSLAEELIALGAVPVVSRCLECGDAAPAMVDEDGCCTTCGGDFVVCLHGLDSVEALDRWRAEFASDHRDRADAAESRLADVEEALHAMTAERDAARATAERERQRALLAEQLASHERGSNIPPRPLWPVASRIRAWLRGAR